MLLPWPIMTGTAAAPQSLAYFDSETSVLGARGGDRVSWLNGLVTCDVSKLAAGAAMPGLLVEKKGKITAEVMVADHEGALAIVVTAGRGPKVHEVFEHHLIMEDVELEALAYDVAFVRNVTAAALAGKGLPAIVLSLGRAHGDEALLLVPRAARAEVEAGLVSLGVTLASEPAFDASRVAAGMPRFGVDYGESHYPQEATLEKISVSFSKGCYLGQEVVYMLENRGHAKRRLSHLQAEGKVSPGPVSTNEGEVAGEITSAAQWGDEHFAIAMLKSSLATPGAVLRAGDVKLTVTDRLV
jgi:folate-binding protein YgfZ